MVLTFVAGVCMIRVSRRMPAELVLLGTDFGGSVVFCTSANLDAQQYKGQGKPQDCERWYVYDHNERLPGWL